MSESHAEIMSIEDMRKLGIGIEVKKQKPKRPNVSLVQPTGTGNITVDGRLIVAGDSDMAKDAEGKITVSLPSELVDVTRGQRAESPEERVRDLEYDVEEKRWFVWKRGRTGGLYKEYR